MDKVKYSPQKTKETYAVIAKFYDVWSYLTESKTARKGFSIAAIKNGEHILEVAVGTGNLFKRIVEANPHGQNIGIDISESMLRMAEKKLNKYRNYILIVSNAYELPFDSDTFDLLFNNYMIDLLPRSDFKKILTEFRRVLKPNGRIVISTMTNGRNWYNRIWEVLADKAPALLTGCRPIDLEKTIGENDFEIIEAHYISQNTFPSKLIYAVKR